MQENPGLNLYIEFRGLSVIQLSRTHISHLLVRWPGYFIGTCYRENSYGSIKGKTLFTVVKLSNSVVTG